MRHPDTWGWWSAGETFFTGALTAAGSDLDHPTLLPGWPRRTLVAHVARNADALVNLLTWARTGTETPMYASTEARDAAIAASAARPAAELVADASAAADRLAVAVRGMPADAWDRAVRTAQGRTVPAATVLWMRCREVWVHAVDLAAGFGFDQVPEDVLLALVDDVVTTWARRDEIPPVAIVTGGRRWGVGEPAVSGSPAAVAGVVTGRTAARDVPTAGSAPPLPRWL